MQQLWPATGGESVAGPNPSRPDAQADREAHICSTQSQTMSCHHFLHMWLTLSGELPGDCRAKEGLRLSSAQGPKDRIFMELSWNVGT